MAASEEDEIFVCGIPINFTEVSIRNAFEKEFGALLPGAPGFKCFPNKENSYKFAILNFKLKSAAEDVLKTKITRRSLFANETSNAAISTRLSDRAKLARMRPRAPNDSRNNSFTASASKVKAKSPTPPTVQQDKWAIWGSEDASSSNNSKEKTCFNCGEPGHGSKECPKPKGFNPSDSNARKEESGFSNFGFAGGSTGFKSGFGSRHTGGFENFQDENSKDDVNMNGGVKKSRSFQDEFGHGASDWQDTSCFKCGFDGHKPKDCPEAIGGISPAAPAQAASARATNVRGTDGLGFQRGGSDVKHGFIASSTSLWPTDHVDNAFAATTMSVDKATNGAFEFGASKPGFGVDGSVLRTEEKRLGGIGRGKKPSPATSTSAAASRPIGLQSSQNFRNDFDSGIGVTPSGSFASTPASGTAQGSLHTPIAIYTSGSSSDYSDSPTLPVDQMSRINVKPARAVKEDYSGFQASRESTPSASKPSAVYSPVAQADLLGVPANVTNSMLFRELSSRFGSIKELEILSLQKGEATVTFQDWKSLDSLMLQKDDVRLFGESGISAQLTVAARLSLIIFVGGLSKTVSARDVFEFFKEDGRLKWPWSVKMQQSRAQKFNYAFVLFDHPNGVRSALSRMAQNNLRLGTNFIDVRPADPNKFSADFITKNFLSGSSEQASEPRESSAEADSDDARGAVPQTFTSTRLPGAAKSSEKDATGGSRIPASAATNTNASDSAAQFASGISSMPADKKHLNPISQQQHNAAGFAKVPSERRHESEHKPTISGGDPDPNSAVRSWLESSALPQPSSKPVPLPSVSPKLVPVVSADQKACGRVIQIRNIRGISTKRTLELYFSNRKIGGPIIAEKTAFSRDYNWASVEFISDEVVAKVLSRDELKLEDNPLYASPLPPFSDRHVSIVGFPVNAISIIRFSEYLEARSKSDIIQILTKDSSQSGLLDLLIGFKADFAVSYFHDIQTLQKLINDRPLCEGDLSYLPVFLPVRLPDAVLLSNLPATCQHKDTVRYAVEGVELDFDGQVNANCGQATADLAVRDVVLNVKQGSAVVIFEDYKVVDAFLLHPFSMEDQIVQVQPYFDGFTSFDFGQD